MARVDRGLDLNAVSILGNGDLVAEVALQSINLEVILEELLESSGVEDLVVCRLLAVDDELSLDRGSLLVCLFDKRYILAYCITP